MTMTDGINIGSFGEGGEPVRTERADAAANRQLILSTAETLFEQRGVHNVTMADIAQAAKVGKGTLYRRYSNKAELSLALMDTQLREFQDASMGRMRQQSVAGVDFMEQLDQFLDALVHFTELHQPLLCEVQRAGLLEHDRNRQMPHYWMHMTVSGLLRSAGMNGELQHGIDIGFLADALLAPLRAEYFRFQREVRGYSAERISTGLRMLLDGFRL